VVFKAQLRDAEVIIKVSSYILQGFNQLQHLSLQNVSRTCNTHWQLLVGVFSQKKDDGADFGCTWIQSNGVIAHVKSRAVAKENPSIS
jgi:hypothetical protein